MREGQSASGGIPGVVKFKQEIAAKGASDVEEESTTWVA